MKAREQGQWPQFRRRGGDCYRSPPDRVVRTIAAMHGELGFLGTLHFIERLQLDGPRVLQAFHS